MRRHLLAGVLAAGSVLAHEGERVESHSWFEVFWDANIAPNLLTMTGIILAVAIIIFFWWMKKHG